MVFLRLANRMRSVMGWPVMEAYATVASILVRNKNITYPKEGLVGGALEGRQLPTAFPPKR